MTQRHPPFSGTALLAALRELNTVARSAVTDGDPDDCHDEYLAAAAELSTQSSAAANMAEEALNELRTGDDTKARQYLETIAHVLGMVSLHTHAPQ